MRITSQFNTLTEVPLNESGQWTSSIWQYPDGIRSIAHHVRASGQGTHCGARRLSSLGSNHSSECFDIITLGVDGFAGPMTRMQSPTDASGYLLVYRTADNALRLYKVDDSGGAFVPTQIFNPQGDLTITPTQPSRIRLESNGSTHTAYFNGVSVGSWTDSTYTGGQPGFWLYEGSQPRQAMMTKWKGIDLATSAMVETDLTQKVTAENPLSDGSVWTSGPGGLAGVYTELGFAYSANPDTVAHFSHVAARRNSPTMDTEQFSENSICSVFAGDAWVGCATNIQSTTDGTCYFALLFKAYLLMLFRYNDPDPSAVLTAPYSDPSSSDFHLIGSLSVPSPVFPLSLRLESKSDGLRVYINGALKTLDSGSVSVDPGTWGAALTGGQPGICFFAEPDEAQIVEWIGGDWTANHYSQTGSGGITFGGAAAAAKHTASATHFSQSGSGGIAFSGAATAFKHTAGEDHFTHVGSGGLTFGGAAPTHKHTSGVPSPRYATPDSFTTGLIPANSAAIFNRAIFPLNGCNIVKLKIVPSGSVIGYKFEIFKRASCLPEDLVYSTRDGVTSTFFAPTDRSGNGVLEGFVVPYEDLDFTNQLHYKVTNRDTIARSYDIETKWDIAVVLESIKYDPNNGILSVYNNITGLWDEFTKD